MPSRTPSRASSLASTEPDWSLLRVFLAVAECGSLSRAAEALGSSQPTLSRQVTALEAQTGSVLFERSRRGVRLTEAGQALRLPAEQMRIHAREWSLTAAGRATSLRGTVRVTASEVVSAYLLPDALRALRQLHPEIQIEIVPSNTLENLLEREADIALRMVRPAQSALVARKLDELPLGLYARRDYVALRGEPTRATLDQHDWIGLDRSDQMLRGFRAAGFEVTREFFAIRCDNQIVAWQAVVGGLGIGVGLQCVAQREPDLVKVLPEVGLPSLPLWITAQRELRGTPRLGVVFDALAAALANPLSPADRGATPRMGDRSPRTAP
ncbi:MAG: LysR family transcriptional regulator [Burkholderiaceae bacterium]|nr:LysR family transcriptional regulator [Burkholderiaceae bacterium]